MKNQVIFDAARAFFVIPLLIFSHMALAKEDSGLPFFFKSESETALSGSTPPSINEFWSEIRRFVNVPTEQIENKDLTGIRISSLTDGSNRLGGNLDYIEIQALKVGPVINEDSRAVKMISLTFKKGGCIDPRIYLSRKIRYQVVPVSMHSATLFEYVAKKGVAYSSVLASGAPYKDIGCARKLVVSF